MMKTKKTRKMKKKKRKRSECWLLWHASAFIRHGRARVRTQDSWPLCLAYDALPLFAGNRPDLGNDDFSATLHGNETKILAAFQNEGPVSILVDTTSAFLAFIREGLSMRIPVGRLVQALTTLS